MEKRILLVDDDAYRTNKCTRILQYLEERGASYDIAITLEEAIEKVLSIPYDGIILDKYFPFKAGEEEKLAAERFLEILSEQGKQIPVIIYSTAFSTIKHELVIDSTNPIDLQKLFKVESLLNYQFPSGTKEENRESERSEI